MFYGISLRSRYGYDIVSFSIRFCHTLLLDLYLEQCFLNHFPIESLMPISKESLWLGAK